MNVAKYIVRIGDMPGVIAQRFTGNAARFTELVVANPQKARQMVHGYATFARLTPGEVILLPAGWAYQPLAGVGATGLGDPNTDGTATAVVDLDGTPRLCLPNVVVLAWQKSYNAAVAAGVYPGAPPLAQVDGEYGAKAEAAMTVVTGSVSVPKGCTTFKAETKGDLLNWLAAITSATPSTLDAPNDNVLAFQDTWNHLLLVTNAPPVIGAHQLGQDGEYGTDTAGAAALLAAANGLPAPPAARPVYAGGGVLTPPVPAPPVPPTPPVPAQASSSTPYVVVGLVALAAAGTFMYLRSEKHGGGGLASLLPKPVVRRLGPGARHAARVVHRRLAAAR